MNGPKAAIFFPTKFMGPPIWTPWEAFLEGSRDGFRTPGSLQAQARIPGEPAGDRRSPSPVLLVSGRRPSGCAAVCLPDSGFYQPGASGTRQGRPLGQRQGAFGRYRPGSLCRGPAEIEEAVFLAGEVL